MTTEAFPGSIFPFPYGMIQPIAINAQTFSELRLFLAQVTFDEKLLLVESFIVADIIL